MPSLEHHKLTIALNSKRERESETQRILDMETNGAPLLYAILIVFALITLYFITADYREHYQLRVENQAMSERLVRIARGEMVAFDGGLASCKYIKLMEGL